MSTRVTKQQFRSALDVLNNVAKQDIFKFADSMDAKPKTMKKTDKTKMKEKPATKKKTEKKPMKKPTKKSTK